MSPSVPLIVIDDSSDGSDGDDSVVEVVANPAAAAAAAAEAASTRSATDARLKDDNEHADGDDDIQDMGTTNALRLPHARHDCTHHAFVPDVLHSFRNTPGFRSVLIATARRDLATNATTCDMCFCFVCDCVASECPSWSIGVGSGSGSDQSSQSSVEFASSMTAASCHCLASCKGANETLWVGMRKDMQKQKQQGNASAGTGNNQGNTGTSNQNLAGGSSSTRSRRSNRSTRAESSSSSSSVRHHARGAVDLTGGGAGAAASASAARASPRLSSGQSPEVARGRPVARNRWESRRPTSQPPPRSPGLDVMGGTSAGTATTWSLSNLHAERISALFGRRRPSRSRSR